MLTRINHLLKSKAKDNALFHALGLKYTCNLSLGKSRKKKNIRIDLKNELTRLGEKKKKKGTEKTAS